MGIGALRGMNQADDNLDNLGNLGKTVSVRKWPIGLNRQVLFLGFVSMFADIASEMLIPITPIFLTSVLGASAMNLGLIEGIAEAIASLMKTFSGSWSDRIRRRRPFIIFGYLAAALSKPMIGMAHTWGGVLSARTLDRFGKGVRGAPRDALLADSIAANERARAFGWHRALDTTGAVIGPLLALGLMVALADDLRMVYFIAIIPGFLSVLFACTLKEVKAEGLRATNLAVKGERKVSKGFIHFLIAWALFCLVNSSDAFLILRAKSLGFSMTQTILVYCLYNVIYAGTSPYLGGLADRLNKKIVVIFGLIVFSMVYFGFAIVTSSWMIIFLFATYGLYAAATDGVGKAYAVDLVSKDAKGFGLGLLGAVTGVMALGASIVAGVLWDKVGPHATFYYGAAGAAFAAAVMAFVPSKAIGVVTGNSELYKPS